MANLPMTTVRAYHHALGPLKDLQNAVEREFGLPSNQQEMVGALIAGTSPRQAFGMLLAYNRYTAELEASNANEQPKG
jgi:hypothetical protein